MKIFMGELSTNYFFNFKMGMWQGEWRENPNLCK